MSFVLFPSDDDTRHAFNGHLLDNLGKLVPECPHSKFYWSRMMEVVVTTGTIRLVSSSQIITVSKPTPNFLLAERPFCRSTNSVGALKGSLCYFQTRRYTLRTSVTCWFRFSTSSVRFYLRPRVGVFTAVSSTTVTIILPVVLPATVSPVLR